MAISPDWFKERADERRWDERKVPLLAVENYIKIQRDLFDASMAMLASSIEVDVCLAINQDFLDRIKRAKRQRETEEEDALTIQFGVKRTRTDNPFLTDNTAEKMKNMDINADGTARVDAVDTAKNPLFRATTGMETDEDI